MSVRRQSSLAANVEVVEPPTNYGEFLKLVGLTEWPYRLTNEGILIHDLREPLGSEQDIEDEIKRKAPLDVSSLNELSGNIEDFVSEVGALTDIFFDPEPRVSKIKNNMFYAPNKAFMTEICNSDAVRSFHKIKFKTFLDSMREAKDKSLENAEYPGFNPNEFNELPHQVEAPFILDTVTNSFDLNDAFKKYWRRIIISEASIGLLLDSFWWIFVTKFHPLEDGCEDQDRLFDRIASSFVALFYSINLDMKDKFLTLYPDYLAQAVFLAFTEAFPESQKTFKSDEFLQDLSCTIHEWVTGFKPLPDSFKNWNFEKLLPKKRSNKAARQDITLRDSLEIEADFATEMSKTNNAIAKLGQGLAPHVTFKLPSDQPESDDAEIGQHSSMKATKESHPAGPGPEMRSVVFNTSGHCPLISHYLVMCQLRDNFQPGQRVIRTEVFKQPPPSKTYREIIKSKRDMSNSLRRQYKEICDNTHSDIQQIELERRKVDRQFDNKRREIVEGRLSPFQIKTMSQEIQREKKEDYNVRKALEEHGSSKANVDV